MANEQFALIEKSKVPSRSDWQASIDKLNLQFELDPELKPFEDSGFLPCKLQGHEAGFEIYYTDDPDLLKDLSHIADHKDYCISFRWGGSMVECASVMIASYALAETFGAVVTYEGEDAMNDLDAFLTETKEIIELAKKDF